MSPSRHEVPQSFKPKWYFTKEEIEDHTPSRKDGIGCEEESHLRKLYCQYIQELGMELKVPQLTIATSMMFCHRFYMFQSHAKNHWQTVANSSMFLACKAEDTPRWLKDFIVVAYKLMYKWDPSASQRIRQREVYDKQKELILLGERLLLATIAFDLNIEHPYKPLVAAVKRLEVSHKEVVKVAWNFVNDWLRTTLCLQYKPHYIAAGSLFLAANFQKIKLPSTNGKAWWMQFDVSPKQLEEVIQLMHKLLGQSSKQALLSSSAAKAQLKAVNRKEKPDCSDIVAQDSSNISLAMTGTFSKSVNATCTKKDGYVDVHDTVIKAEHCQTSDSGSANSVVEDADGEPIIGAFCQKSGCQILSVKECHHKIDITQIREKIKRRKLDRAENSNSGKALDEEIDSETWIEMELEKGIDPVSHAEKQ